ncbi:hypothetical protein F4802DRAFT_549161 [Xylaria palmicola]|nr:hypothetical protein F4802DRAFT_549161 [Xylaria palmicola]
MEGFVLRKNRVELSKEYDTMGEVYFSNYFGMLDRPDSHYFLETLLQGVNDIHTVSTPPDNRTRRLTGARDGWMPMLFRLKLGYSILAKVAKGLNCFGALSRYQVVRRLELNDKVSVSDVFSHLLRGNRKATIAGVQEILNPKGLIGESSLFTIVGRLSTCLRRRSHAHESSYTGLLTP